MLYVHRLRNQKALGARSISKPALFQSDYATEDLLFLRQQSSHCTPQGCVHVLSSMPGSSYILTIAAVAEQPVLSMICAADILHKPQEAAITAETS